MSISDTVFTQGGSTSYSVPVGFAVHYSLSLSLSLPDRSRIEWKGGGDQSTERLALQTFLECLSFVVVS